MGVQLLDKTRKSTNYCTTIVRVKLFNDICEVLTEILNSKRISDQ